MAETACCPICGMKLAPNAPRGLCPGCLFRGALEAQASQAGEAAADRFGDSPPTPQELASEFPDLEILHFVGRGGMGMVYKAKQKQLDRTVALKILSLHIARDTAFAERFAREARTMAMLSHPHIVAVHDFGATSRTEAGDRDVPLYYFLMEFVDGLTLRQLLDASQLTPPQAFAIVPQICEALQYAHDKGIVHRDIKPENILMDREGHVKIADFGLAKLMGLEGHDLTISTTGQVLGTVHYMAPEQVERPMEVDHRADIYSLGVVFYQMLTGELPLGRFAPPSQKAPVDARLDEVVMRALEKEPGRRYQQASALQSQVETIAATRAALHDDLSAPGRHRSRFSALIGKSRLARGAVALFLFCVVAGFLVYFWSEPVTSRKATAGSLADSPFELKKVSTARVIEAGIEKPLSPWAWRELERRQISASDVDTIIARLTEWLHREHPDGMSHPLHSLDRFLQYLDAQGLVTEPRKFEFLEALHGELRTERSHRLRAGTHFLSLNVEWRWIWSRQLFGMTLMNELQPATIDGEPTAPPDPRFFNWDGPICYLPLQLPPLKAGKHAVRLSVLSALASTADLVGLGSSAPSADWPPARKRWIRTIDLEVSIYADDAEIISATQDPSLDPVSAGLKIEPLVIRGGAGHKNAGLKFNLPQALPVPIGFDVSLHLAGQTIPCGSLWAVKGRQGGLTSNGAALSVDIPELGAEVKTADVVLTPNAKLIDLRPDVDRIWGSEVVFRNVSLRRLDGTESDSRDVQVP